MFEFVDVSSLESRALETVYAVADDIRLVDAAAVNGVEIGNVSVETDGADAVVRYTVAENDVTLPDGVVASYEILCTLNFVDGVCDDYEILFTRWADSDGDVRSYGDC